MPIWRADPHVLRAAIRSILAQTLRDFELLILEDASEVAARPTIEEFGDERIRHFVHPEKSSMAAARNRGLALAHGAFVAMHDGDDVSHESRLERQFEFLHANPDIDVVGSAIRVIDAEGRPVGMRDYPTTHDAILAALPRFNPIAHPSVMARKTSISDAGGYDEASTRVCEDYELWSRLAHRGGRFCNLTEALLDYRLHANASKRTRLRATLADTIEIKDRYWSDARSTGDRVRIAIERGLLRMPSGFVYWLFRKTHLQSW
ncbi:MAG: glycosyltransferase [Planctomycetes bacterium]|nr:glycosyltransferase [Planctomycetota bacterium]MCB9919039.1 glycosyltransferase [Planctomycetota bacterium]